MTITTCSPSEAHQRHAAGTAHLVDVRTAAEYRGVHAVEAALIPLDQLDCATLAAGVPAGRTLHLLCKSGARARMAAQRLAAAGITCTVVEGGTDAWIAAGLPVVRGKATMSLERQARIGAGVLVLIGVTLGFTVHPYWFGLAGLVGAGLTFAGLTDICLMGMLFARMPWNR
jgi:rhodanese-related sulfurtransferase